MGLKFMERAQQKEKEALKSEVNLAVKQIKGEDDYSADSEDASSNDENTEKKSKFVDASAKFGVKAMKTSSKVDARETGKQLDADKVLKAARRVTSNNAKDESSDMSDDEPAQPK